MAMIEKRVVGLVVVEEGGSVSGKPVHSDRLDIVASSPSWPGLKNNEIHCSVGKNVSEQRTVHLALSSTLQVMNIPVVQDQMHPKVHNNPPHGCQTAVVSIHQRFHEELHRLCLDGSKLGCKTLDEHDDNEFGHHPVDPRENMHRKDVHVGSAVASTRCRGRRGRGIHRGNKHRWTFIHKQQCVLDTLTSSSYPQNLSNNKVDHSPVSQCPTCSKMRYSSTSGCATVASLAQPRSKKDSQHGHLEVSKLCQMTQ
jgi:hypothetical protein